MLDSLQEFVRGSLALELGLLASAGSLAFLFGYLIPLLIKPIIQLFFSPQTADTYQKILSPYKALTGLVIVLAITDLVWLVIPDDQEILAFFEIPISFAFTVASSWLASRLFKEFFDIYLLETALKTGRKTNSELLLLGKFLANLIIVFVAISLFFATHNINIFGVIASLGIGGLAVAFAAQKTLEQVLGGIVLYLDQPFVVDDYIGLPDGTFGRVESIGLRSTKIRATGKGTLVIVPNSQLTQSTIENLTGAKKIMAIVYLNFHKTLEGEEKALIRQIIVESTLDIFGIDSRNTDVAFREQSHQSEESRTQAQITFFILGTGDVSLELRRQVLDLANQKVNNKLREYGIYFDIEEPTIYVDAPITI